MSALESLQPEECLRHFLSSDLLESLLCDPTCDFPELFPVFHHSSSLPPGDLTEESSEAVPSESRIHKYVQQPKDVPVHLMQRLELEGVCTELRHSLIELNTPTLLIADRLKPGVLLKSLKGEIQLLLSKSQSKRPKRRRQSNKENQGQELGTKK